MRYPIHTPRRITAVCLILLAAPLGAQGYEWDHPDQVGVRYLLYRKMQQRKVHPEHEGDQLRLAYVVNDPSEFVQVQGYPMEWGVEVYDFAPLEAAETKRVQAESFAHFVTEADPQLATAQRHFVVRDKAASGGLRLWEFRDTSVLEGWTSGGSGVGTGMAWGHHRALGIRLWVDKKMTFRPRGERDPERQVGAFYPPSKEWVRVPGRKVGVAWPIELHWQAEPAEDARWFAPPLADAGRRRTWITDGVETRGRRGAYRLYEFQDDLRSPETGKGTVRHFVVAVYAQAGGEVALVGRVPFTDRPHAKVRAALLRMLGTVESHQASDKDGLGNQRYHVAASRTVDGRDVAVLVEIPLEPGKPPKAELLGRARRMVRSLEPAEKK